MRVYISHLKKCPLPVVSKKPSGTPPLPLKQKYYGKWCEVSSMWSTWPNRDHKYSRQPPISGQSMHLQELSNSRKGISYGSYTNIETWLTLSRRLRNMLNKDKALRYQKPRQYRQDFQGIPQLWYLKVHSTPKHGMTPACFKTYQCNPASQNGPLTGDTKGTNSQVSKQWQNMFFQKKKSMHLCEKTLSSSLFRREQFSRSSISI